MNYDVFNDILPATAATDIASSSTSFMRGVSNPVILLVGVFLAFIVADIIIAVVRNKK